MLGVRSVASESAWCRCQVRAPRPGLPGARAHRRYHTGFPTVPLYLAEISPPSIRGQVVGFYDAVLQIGGLLGFWIAYGVDRHVPPTSTQWRIPIAVQLIPGGLFVIISLFLIESPRWLLKVGKDEQALKNLERIRQLPASDKYMQEEVAMVKEQIEKELLINGHKATYLQMLRELFKKGIRNRLAVGILVFCKWPT